MSSLKLVRTGRPTKLTEESKTAIVDALRAGATREAAAEAAGINRSTLFAWLAAGRRGEPPFSDFSAAVKKAEAEMELTAVRAIRKAGESGTWTAFAWLLERRRPKRWAKREYVQATPPTREEAIAELREIVRTDPELAAELVQKAGT